MSEIKLTKNELRTQQSKLKTLQVYLPTLQLKKTLLQAEILEAQNELLQAENKYLHVSTEVEKHSLLLRDDLSFDISEATQINKLHKRRENIAGVEIPQFESVEFQNFDYSLADTPIWIDSLIDLMQSLATAKIIVDIAQEKKLALENELRAVSIKVNLFEKVLIPRAQSAIRKIKVYLGDQQLAAVSQAKVAKRKIDTRKASTWELVDAC